MARGGYRPGAGRKKAAGSTAARRQLGFPQFPPPPTTVDESPAGIAAKASAEGLSPLEYMLRIMSDPAVDPARRDRMAIAAAPFFHPRKGDGAGKKKDLSDKAKAASSGKFAPAAPPLRRVK